MIGTMVKNPIINSDVPDPSVIRVRDVYYMTSTTMYFTPGCPIMKSYDLANWEIIGYVYDILSHSDHMTLSNDKNDYGKGSWASCLRYNEGIFYVSFVAYNMGETYVFQTDDIESGNWKKAVIQGIYHDMSLLFDEGRVFMVYGSGVIKVAELTEDATAIKPDGLNKILIANADPSGEDSLAEGSHVYKYDGRYYIFIISWPKTGTGRRIQVCYRSEKIDGTYEHKIVLDDDMGFNNAGIAQGGIVDTPEGKWYALLFQDRMAVGRVPVLVPLAWNEGWPIMGINGKVPEEVTIPLKPSNGKFSLLTPDEFNNEKLAITWQWNHNPDNNYWSLSERPGWLRLTAGHVTDNVLKARNTLTQRTYAPVCSGMIKIDTTNMKDGDMAGLIALQERYGLIGVKASDGKKHIIMETNDGRQEQIRLNQDVIYLKIDFDFRSGRDVAQFHYSYSGNSLYRIGNNLEMVYSLEHFTGYRFGIFNFATSEIGGFVDVDWFRVL